jgi:hypothetical protein
MGRTIPSATQVFMKEEQAFGRFRRALRRTDQAALDDLFASAQKHLAVVAYASHALPFETMLLAMLLEEHKLVMQLRGMLVELTSMPHGIEAADDQSTGHFGGFPFGDDVRPPRLVPKEQPRLEIPPAQMELELEAHKEETHSENVVEKVK